MPQPMMVKKDSAGVTKIETLDKQSITFDRILEIQTYDEAWQQNEMKELQTHEKMIWLKCKLEKETPNLTLGSNSITVDRNQLLTDSMNVFDGI